MSSKTPNDVLLHKTNKSKMKPASSGHLSTKLKDMFINSKQREELMTACSKGDLPRVSHLLEQKNPGLNPDLIRDSKLRTPLLVACAAGQAAVVRTLIRWGADVNNPMGDIVNNKPLDLAVISNDVDTVLALLEAGAKVSKSEISNSSLSATDRPLPVHIRAGSRTPLDLAQSRLDMLIKQSENTSAANNANTMDQVIKIIELLKHFLPKDDIQDLTSMLESINLMNQPEELIVMKNLREVISKMNIG